MVKIDSHQHFWKFNPARHAWIGDDMTAIRKDFLPSDLWPHLQSRGIGGCVSVQADQSREETMFLLEQADRHSFVKGVVGWVDLQADDIDHQLHQYSSFEKIKGFRHVLQDEKQRDFMLRPAFLNGIGHLAKYGFTYDILIYPDQLNDSRELVEKFPEQAFVIDHLAKPKIKTGEISGWEKDIRRIAEYENVFCKVSGMVTEADWGQWKKEDFYPYLDVVVEAFGPSRLMYGSDWPVALLAGSYAQVFELADSYFKSFSDDERDAFFGGNAISFYNLKAT